MKIKLNENQVIRTKDVRNIELETTLYRTVAGKQVPQKNVGYYCNLETALKAAARAFPLVTKAKTSAELETSYNEFLERLESILASWKLPDNKLMLSATGVDPTDGLIGEDDKGHKFPIGSKMGDGSYNPPRLWEDEAAADADDWNDDGFNGEDSDDDDWNDDDDDWEEYAIKGGLAADDEDEWDD